MILTLVSIPSYFLGGWGIQVVQVPDNIADRLHPWDGLTKTPEATLEAWCEHNRATLLAYFNDDTTTTEEQ